MYYVIHPVKINRVFRNIGDILPNDIVQEGHLPYVSLIPDNTIPVETVEVCVQPIEPVDTCFPPVLLDVETDTQQTHEQEVKQPRGRKSKKVHE